MKNEDYINILNFYKLSLPGTMKNIKRKASRVISNKFCRCIKALETKYKSGKAIGICTRSVINRKGFKRGKWTCDKSKNKTKKNILVLRNKK